MNDPFMNEPDPFLNEPVVDPFMHEVTHADCRCKEDQQAIASLTSWGPENASQMLDPTCPCRCKVCNRCRNIHEGIVRRAKLELKLANDGIDIGDFADIMWHRFLADGLERWVSKRVAESLRGHLLKIRLKSTVSITNESVQGLDDSNSR